MQRICVDTEAWSVEYKLNATGPWWCYCEGSQDVGTLMSRQTDYRSCVCFDLHDKQVPDFFLKKNLLVKCHKESEGHV